MVKARKTKFHAQEVAQLEEAAPARTCRKATNVNASNLPTKKIEQSTKSLEKIRQARKYIFICKKQKRKPTSKQDNARDGCHNMLNNATTK